MMARKKVLVGTKKKMNCSSYPDVEKIRQRAYSIWEERGRPQNSDLDIWLEAEREIKI